MLLYLPNTKVHFDGSAVLFGLYPPVHTLPHRTQQQQISAIFVNIQAESYLGIHCSFDQAMLPLGRVDLVLKFKKNSFASLF